MGSGERDDTSLVYYMSQRRTDGLTRNKRAERSASHEEKKKFPSGESSNTERKGNVPIKLKASSKYWRKFCWPESAAGSCL